MLRPSLSSRLLILAVLIGAAGLSGACRSRNAPAPTGPANRGIRTAVPFETVRSSFQDPDMIYAPFIFWFWDEPLNPAKMAEMSRVMAGQRFSPGYAHARKSMVGTPDLPDAEWLGDKWFAAFDAALKEAEACENYLGYCDEYWWPSFQANGRVLAARPDLRAASLSWETLDVPGGSETQVPASFFAVAAELGRGASAKILSRTLQVIGAGAPFAWKAPRTAPGASTSSTPIATPEPTGRTSTISTHAWRRRSSRSRSNPMPADLATSSAVRSPATSSTMRATTAGAWPGPRRSTSATRNATAATSASGCPSRSTVTSKASSPGPAGSGSTSSPTSTPKHSGR